jgi:AhpD family alkylhydroperoxidase
MQLPFQSWSADAHVILSYIADLKRCDVEGLARPICPKTSPLLRFKGRRDFEPHPDNLLGAASGACIHESPNLITLTSTIKTEPAQVMGLAALDCFLLILEGVKELNERYRGMLMNNGNADLSKKDGLRHQVANAFGPDMQRLLVYFSLYENAFIEGALPGSVKHLIALAMTVGQRNAEGITYHTNEALQAGATRDQIQEAVTVAVLIGGAPSLLAGAEALATVARFEALKITAAGEPPLTGTDTHAGCSVSSSEPEGSSVSARGARQLRGDHRRPHQPPSARG